MSDEDLRKLGYTVGRGSGPGASAPAEPEPDEAPSRGDRVQARIRFGPAAIRWVGTLALYGAVVFLSLPTRYLPDPLPAAAPDSVFSSARAMAHVVEIARLPRQIGSPEHTRARDYVLSRLSLLDIEADVRVMESAGPMTGGRVRAATVRNVVARLPGREAGAGAIVLTAPYDGPALSPAAGRSLGAASLLEVVRVLSASEPLDLDVVAVFTDGSTVDATGLRAFLRGNAGLEAGDIRLILSADAYGATGPAHPFGPAADRPAIQQVLAGAASEPSSATVAGALARLSSAATRPGDGPRPAHEAMLDFVAVGGASIDGQPFDTRDRVSERTLQHTGNQLLGMVRAAAGSDGDAGASGRSATWVAGVGALSVPEGRVAFLPLAALLVLGLVGLALRFRGGGWRGGVAGLLLACATVGLTSWVGALLLRVVSARHVESGALRGAVYRDGVHELALLAVGVAVVATLHTVARRWFRRDELNAGALVLPVLLGPLVAWTAPGAAVAFHLPMLLALSAALLVTAVGPRRASGWLVAPVVVVLQALTIAVAVPSLVAASGLWSFANAPLLGGLFGLTLVLLLPSAEILRRPRAWVLPVVAATAAAVLVAAAIPRGRANQEHPVPTSLVWLTDEVAESRLTALIPDAVPSDSTGRRRMAGRWLSRPGPGEAWARSWVAEPDAGTGTTGRLLLPREAEYRSIGSGPDAELLPPTIVPVARTVDGGATLLEVDVRSGLGGEMIAVLVDPAHARVASVGTLRLGSAPPVHTLEHWGVPRAEAVRVGLSVQGAVDSVDVTVIEHHLRPREVLGSFFFERADSVIPDVSAGTDRVIQRTTIRVGVPDSILPPPPAGDTVTVSGEPGDGVPGALSP